MKSLEVETGKIPRCVWREFRASHLLFSGYGFDKAGVKDGILETGYSVLVNLCMEIRASGQCYWSSKRWFSNTRKRVTDIGGCTCV
jgi:hypothetical protein